MTRVTPREYLALLGGFGIGVACIALGVVIPIALNLSDTMTRVAILFCAVLTPALAVSWMRWFMQPPKIEGERQITVRRKDGALVTTTLDPTDMDSISRFLDVTRVPEPRADKQEGE